MMTSKFGNSGFEVSALGLGCMGLSFGYPRTLNALACVNEVLPPTEAK